MAKIGGFDPGVGILPLADGRREIGRTNLPAGTKMLPESLPAQTDALVYGKMTDSALLDGFTPYLQFDLKHRELLSPDAFFETLEQAAETFRRQAGEDGNMEEGPMAEAARSLAAILADREMCEMLRNLVLKA